MQIETRMFLIDRYYSKRIAIYMLNYYHFEKLEAISSAWKKSSNYEDLPINYKESFEVPPRTLLKDCIKISDGTTTLSIYSFNSKHNNLKKIKKELQNGAFSFMYYDNPAALEKFNKWKRHFFMSN